MDILKLIIISLFSFLVACGGDGKNQEQQKEDGKSTNKFKFIEQNDNGMNYVEMDVVELAGSNSILGTKQSNPLDVYPNSPFEFQWKLKSEVVVFANSFLVLNIEGREIPIFATIMNPYPEIMTNKATCEYDNNHFMICNLIEIPQHIGARVPKDFSAVFLALPKTVEVFSTICSITRGCDKISLGYLRIN